MKIYRLRLKPLSAFLTPWHADTIFGAVCWVMAWRDGEEALARFLREYKDGNPPFVLSDGMPGDLLPAPASLSLRESKENTLEEYRKNKRLKKVSWLTSEEFEAVRRGNHEVEPKEDAKAFKPAETLHSSINRNTGTTDEGALFELEEYALEADSISIYLKIKDDWEGKVVHLFKDLSMTGYGKKKSVGKGSFELSGELEAFDKFNDFNGANGFVSLSSFVPAKNDPTEGFHKTLVKYGKLDGEFALSGNPFKKPLLMLTAGSVFKVEETIKPFYGRMVEGIAPHKPEIVHYGYAFAVPVAIGI